MYVWFILAPPFSPPLPTPFSPLPPFPSPLPSPHFPTSFLLSLPPLPSSSPLPPLPSCSPFPLSLPPLPSPSPLPLSPPPLPSPSPLPLSPPPLPWRCMHMERSTVEGVACIWKRVRMRVVRGRMCVYQERIRTGG